MHAGLSPLRTWTDATMLMLSCLALSAAPLHQSFVAAASSKRSPIDLTLPRTQTLPRTNRKHISHTHASTRARARTHTYTDSRTQTHPHTHTRILIQTHACAPASNGPSQPKQRLEHKTGETTRKKTTGAGAECLGADLSCVQQLDSRMHERGRDWTDAKRERPVITTTTAYVLHDSEEYNHGASSLLARHGHQPTKNRMSKSKGPPERLQQATDRFT